MLSHICVDNGFAGIDNFVVKLTFELLTFSGNSIHFDSRTNVPAKVSKIQVQCFLRVNRIGWKLICNGISAEYNGFLAALRETDMSVLWRCCLTPFVEVETYDRLYAIYRLFSTSVEQFHRTAISVRIQQNDFQGPRLCRGDKDHWEKQLSAAHSTYWRWEIMKWFSLYK